MPLVQALILDPVGHDQVWNRMWESSVTHVSGTPEQDAGQAHYGQLVSV